MTDNLEQQKDEINLLENIIPDKMKILQSEPSYELELTIQGNVNAPKMEFILTIELPEDYPTEVPHFKLEENNNYLSSSKKKILEEKLNEICQEYIGLPVVYQLYEAVLTFADEEEENLLNEEIKKDKIKKEKKLLEEKKLKEEEDLLQNETYTPVTKKLFDKWYKGFIDEMHALKGKQVNDGKLTGREFFLNKNIKLDVNEDEIEAEKVDKKDENDKELENVNPEMFEEDIGDIDFDNEDNMDEI